MYLKSTSRLKIILSNIFILGTNSLISSSFFNNWICIGISNKINYLSSNPHKVNIGDLPLIIWRNPSTKKLISTINICKHMGSRLDKGTVLPNGCVKCPYHGLEIDDQFGKVIEHQGKIFWAYDPIEKTPPKMPFYNNKNFEKSFLEIDMDCSLQDSAYNTMDLRHPEFVHNKMFGFGNVVPPQNIKHYKYSNNDIGMSFDYSSNSIMKMLNDNINVTNNFHMYVYPTFSWSKVTFNKKHLLIGVNLLPLKKKKTRWYVTVVSNYYKSSFEQNFLQKLAETILNQDYIQMKNQFEENELKKKFMFQHVFPNEEPILELNKMFESYKYPDTIEVLKLLNEKNKLNPNI